MMNIKIKTRIKTACLLALGIAFLSSCKKDEPTGTINIAKVNVINAVVGGNLKANVVSKQVNWSSIADISYGMGKLHVVTADQSTILKVVPSLDTNKVWYNRTARLKAGAMYSLYLSGTPDKIDTLFHEETGIPTPILRDAGRKIPAADSVVNIRFVNLSASGPAMDINIEGKSSNEAANLGYRQFTDFKAYAAKSYKDGITLEIRNTLTKELIGYGYVDTSKWGSLFKTVSLLILPEQGFYTIVEVSYNNVTN